ncbi:hypothetical protein SAY87_009842 [Trapa incisa]|uniref:Patatin n=1 Tax=Trapa incisa TaxID=236973 RepID=A0AAN7K1V6_9MYRT|nr:hypothetical protein SAY87_009842 [Trapa incisa]
MAFDSLSEMHKEPSIDTDKLSYEIFSILESEFLFGHDNSKLRITGQVPVLTAVVQKPDVSSSSSQTEASSSPLSVSDAGLHPPKIRVLSIDGGCSDSLRGILPCRALAHLERAIREKSNDPKATIAGYFDVVAGTGIGGVVAAMLFATRDGSRPAFEAEDTWRLLCEQWKRTFKSSGGGGGGLLRRIFSGGGGRDSLEKFLKETFGGGSGSGGRALTLKDTLKPILIPCYDLSTAAPFLFSRAGAMESDGYDFRLWEVCRATTAEPDKTEPVNMSSVDGKNRCVGLGGGLVMGNPTAAAITHVLHNGRDFPDVRGMEDLLVLSLGSGPVIDNAMNRKTTKDSNRFALRVAGDEFADTVDQAVGMGFSNCRTGTYVRIQANTSNLKADSDSDSGPHSVKKVAEEMLRQKNVESVLFSGKKVSEQTNFEKLDLFATELVMEHHRRRSWRASAP